MRLQLRYHSDVDLSQPAMQVEVRSHIDGVCATILTVGRG